MSQYAQSAAGRSVAAPQQRAGRVALHCILRRCGGVRYESRKSLLTPVVIGPAAGLALLGGAVRGGAFMFVSTFLWRPWPPTDPLGR